MLCVGLHGQHSGKPIKPNQPCKIPNNGTVDEANGTGNDVMDPERLAKVWYRTVAKAVSLSEVQNNPSKLTALCAILLSVDRFLLNLCLS